LGLEPYMRARVLRLLDEPPREEDDIEAMTAELREKTREALSLLGGTPLYLKALLRGMFELPPPDEAFRDEMRAFAQRCAAAGKEDGLHAKLREADPRTAARLHPNDTKRIIRALEVQRATGESITALQQQFDQSHLSSPPHVFCLCWPREQLHARIDQRVLGMMEQGLEAEVRQLLAKYPCLSRTARQAAGYREMIDTIEGRCTRDDAIRTIQQRTRQLAKRQETWFRSLSEIHFVEMRPDFDARRVAKDIFSIGATSGSVGTSLTAGKGIRV